MRFGLVAGLIIGIVSRLPYRYSEGDPKIKTSSQTDSAEVWLFSGFVPGRNTPQITPSELWSKASAAPSEFLMYSAGGVLHYQ